MKTFRLKKLTATLAVALGVLACGPLLAQQEPAPTMPEGQQPSPRVVANPAQANMLQQSVIKGLQNSPVLDADVHALEGLMEDANVRFGGMLPTVDVRGSAGRERSKIENGENRTYNASSYGIEARQNIFSGYAGQARYFAAYSEAMQGYYRYLNKANQVAFEASSAHIDVSRNQALTKLAESNLKYHQDLMARIEEKVSSGVARQSDLEQARSRYTLALSNLATEKANTFSAMANYQRLTNAIWPASEMGEYIINANFEVENRERLVFALNTHPLLRASNAQIQGAKHLVTVAGEGFYPRLDLRAKSDVYSNYLSTFSERTISSVDLLASMNLYRGGADVAARNAASKRKLRSMDDKLVVCRGIRQGTQTALYDVVNLQKKLNYFRQQADSIAKARAAYEQQFIVGKRSLLDLLSAENEHFQAQRALINVEADLSISKLKLLAATGQLVSLFGVDDLVKADEPTRKQVLFYQEAQQEAAEAETCPADLISLDEFELPNIGFDEEFKNVKSLDMPTPSTVLSSEATIAKNPNMVLAQANVASAPGVAAGAATGGAAFADPSVVSKSLTEQTNAWAQSWAKRDANAYIGFYSPAFKPEQGTFDSWQAQRRERLRNATSLNIEVSELQVIPNFDDPTVYEVVFIQNYRAANYQEKSKKVLTWKQKDGRWLIVREQNMPANAVYKPERTSLNVAATAIASNDSLASK